MSFPDRQLPPANAEAYFVWPRGGNTGDHLIKLACLRFLRDSRIDVWESDGGLEAAALNNDLGYLRSALAQFTGFIFFPGGGNLGIYPDNEMVRTRVIGAAASARGVLVFSQSAYAPETCLLSDRVRVWARERASLEVLERSGTRATLVPDCALYLDDQIPKRPSGAGHFQIRRAPGRDAERIEHRLGCEGADTGDPTFELPLDDVVQLLSPYRAVSSDRLHGAILSMMLRKRTALLPVGYHKCRSFYDTWFADHLGVAFVETPAALERFVLDNASPACDLKALFSEHASPAFSAFLDESCRASSRLVVGQLRRDQRVVSITCVRDEADIIEAFVRHTAAHVDQLVLMDNGSTDGTWPILEALKAEGLPLLLHSDESMGHWQAERTTTMMRDIAVSQCDADWVLPLDADEFVVTAAGVSLRSALRHRSKPVHVRWVTYVPDLTDDPTDPNPATRMRHRASSEAVRQKVIVPRCVARESSAKLHQGSHGVDVDGHALETEPLDAVHLAHLPVRSLGQFAAKVAIRRLQYLAMGSRNEAWGSHLIPRFDRLRQREAEFIATWRDAALIYAPLGTESGPTLPVEDPLPYAGTELRYTKGPSQELESLHGRLLGYAEQLATSHGAIDGRLVDTEGRRADLEAERAGLALANIASEEESNRLRRVIDQYALERVALEARNRRLSDERAGLLSSTSWRITEPLRMLRRQSLRLTRRSK